MWEYNGKQRPDFADAPANNQESVWDYPRPPALVPLTQLVEVKVGETLLARSEQAMRILETASPPTIYIPPSDVMLDVLIRVPGNSYCEWKGAADYWALSDRSQALPVGWSYPDISREYSDIRDWLSFYPARVSCFIDGERVRGQEGGFYGGWVTDSIAGPWKGASGTSQW